MSFCVSRVEIFRQSTLSESRDELSKGFFLWSRFKHKLKREKKAFPKLKTFFLRAASRRAKRRFKASSLRLSVVNGNFAANFIIRSLPSHSDSIQFGTSNPGSFFKRLNGLS